jgi:hypothetical protein
VAAYNATLAGYRDLVQATEEWEWIERMLTAEERAGLECLNSSLYRHGLTRLKEGLPVEPPSAGPERALNLDVKPP